MPVIWVILALLALGVLLPILILIRIHRKKVQNQVESPRLECPDKVDDPVWQIGPHVIVNNGDEIIVHSPGGGGGMLD